MMCLSPACVKCSALFPPNSVTAGRQGNADSQVVCVQYAQILTLQLSNIIIVIVSCDVWTRKFHYFSFSVQRHCIHKVPGIYFFN